MYLGLVGNNKSEFISGLKEYTKFSKKVYSRSDMRSISARVDEEILVLYDIAYRKFGQIEFDDDLLIPEVILKNGYWDSDFKGLIVTKELNRDVVIPFKKERVKDGGRIDNVKDLESLIQLLKDDDMGVRCEAVDALGDIGDPRAVEPLIIVLKEGYLKGPTKEQYDSDPEVRSRAADALAKIGDSRAVESLINALKDDDEEVRADVAEALGVIGDNRAIEALKILSKEDVEFVQMSAEKAIKRIKAKSMKNKK
jgi:hypothetical protein